MTTKATSPTNWVGIDVCKAKLDVYILSDATYRVFENTEDGIAELVTWLQSYANVGVVCEATGGYEAEMARALYAAGMHVSVVNPRPVRDLARALSKLAKTDPIDAY
ncbi:MAG: IS110 family transposase, partial [Phormidesmis sp. RL_2_1]|nr:IS110 family transposase [Phormidesmis sp. RL_2_1]